MIAWGLGAFIFIAIIYAMIQDHTTKNTGGRNHTNTNGSFDNNASVHYTSNHGHHHAHHHHTTGADDNFAGAHHHDSGSDNFDSGSSDSTSID